MSFVNLGGVSPIGPRARRRLRSPVANPVTKVSGGMGGARLAGGTFQRGAAPGRGGGFHGGSRGGRGRGGRHHRGHRRHRGGFFPYYPYPYYSLYPYYGYGGYGYDGYQQERETVPSACCYNVETGSLYCPGSEYDGAPAFAEATRMYQGRPMSYVTSPQLGQAQWFWNCPTAAEPSAIVPGRGLAPPGRRARLRRAA